MPTPHQLPPEILQRLIDSSNKPVAPIWARGLAFLVDALTVWLTAIVVLKFALPYFWGNELHEASREIHEQLAAYTELSMHATDADVLERSQKILESQTSSQAVLTILNVSNSITLGIAFFYFLLTEYFTKGASAGKKIFKIRSVSQLTGEAPNLWQCISRSLWRACTIAPPGIIITLIVIINAHVPFFSYRRRAWHDKLSRTEVIDCSKE